MLAPHRVVSVDVLLRNDVDVDEMVADVGRIDLAVLFVGITLGQQEQRMPGTQLVQRFGDIREQFDAGERGREFANLRLLRR